MPRRHAPSLRTILSTLLSAGLVLGLGLAIWLGRLPPEFNPFRLTSLADPEVWFLDFKLAELRADRAQCAALLKPPYIAARPVADQPMKEGCGWLNAVRIESVSSARLVAERVTCPLAAGLALWMHHEVQPLAQSLLGSRVAALQQIGVYACRNIVGAKAFGSVRSEHAEANAIDLAGFVLADGRTISVLKHWQANGREGEFLRQAHARACRYFRVALGPAFNEAHRDHFHYDRGELKYCR